MKLWDRLLERKNNRIRKPHGYDIPPAVRHFYAHIDEIIGEWERYMACMQSVGVPIDELSKDQKLLNEDKKWKAFFVFVYGFINPEAEKHFPLTVKLSKKWKKEVKLVFFSSLEPGKKIPPHYGRNHGIIRTQIGINIQQPEETGLRVHDKTVHLKEKEVFTFDDTFEHEAWNVGTQYRTVLIIDTCNKFSYIYGLINRWKLRKLEQTDYVQSVIARLKEASADHKD